MALCTALLGTSSFHPFKKSVWTVSAVIKFCASYRVWHRGLDQVQNQTTTHPMGCGKPTSVYILVRFRSLYTCMSISSCRVPCQSSFCPNRCLRNGTMDGLQSSYLNCFYILSWPVWICYSVFLMYQRQSQCTSSQVR